MSRYRYEAHVFDQCEQDVAVLRVIRRDTQTGKAYVPEEIVWRKLAPHEALEHEKSLFPLERRAVSMLAYDVDKFGPSFYHWSKGEK